jgi:hypothetical protein
MGVGEIVNRLFKSYAESNLFSLYTIEDLWLQTHIIFADLLPSAGGCENTMRNDFLYLITHINKCLSLRYVFSTSSRRCNIAKLRVS